jgi:hypothetical protein
MSYEEVRELLVQDLALMGDHRTYLASLLRGELYQVYKERDRYREALELIVENYKAMSPWDNKLIIPNLRIANEALEGENRND